MTTKERLHQLVDQLSDVEAEAALRAIVARRTQASDDAPVRIDLDDEQMAGFLDALEHPEAFEPGLRDLFERP